MPQDPDHIGSFIRRVATAGSRPVHEFAARAGIGIVRPPRNPLTLPLGDVFLYREGLIFLTLEVAPPGDATKAKWMEEQRRARELAASILSSIADQDWLTLLSELGKIVGDSGPSNEELLAGALSSPNSFLLLPPYGQVQSGLRRFRWNYLVIESAGGVNAVLCQAVEEESPFQYMTTFRSTVWGGWQEEAAALLRSSAVGVR